MFSSPSTFEAAQSPDEKTLQIFIDHKFCLEKLKPQPVPFGPK